MQDRYLPRFQSLQADCEGKLNGLMEQGRKEAKALSVLGGSALELVPKYEQAGRQLKTECDGRFFALAGLMEAELKARSLPLDPVLQAKEVYHALITRKQAELVAKITER